MSTTLNKTIKNRREDTKKDKRAIIHLGCDIKSLVPHRTMSTSAFARCAAFAETYLQVLDFTKL
jgi:hypothetical protein